MGNCLTECTTIDYCCWSIKYSVKALRTSSASCSSSSIGMPASSIISSASSQFGRNSFFRASHILCRIQEASITCTKAVISMSTRLVNLMYLPFHLPNKDSGKNTKVPNCLSLSHPPCLKKPAKWCELV